MCSPATASELVDMQVEAVNRVNAWCRDLLEPTRVSVAVDLDTSPNPVIDSVNTLKVDVLHRTVKEYMTTPDMQKLLQKQSGHFCRWSTLTRLFIAKTKILSSAEEGATEMLGFRRLAGEAMLNAREAELRQSSSNLVPLLRELDRVGNALQPAKTLKTMHWSNLDQSKTKAHPRSDFTAYAVAFGIQQYVQYALDRLPQDQRSMAAELYYYAIQTIFRSQDPDGQASLMFPRTDMIKLLHQKGVDHKQKVAELPNPSIRDAGYFTFLDAYSKELAETTLPWKVVYQSATSPSSGNRADRGDDRSWLRMTGFFQRLARFHQGCSDSPHNATAASTGESCNSALGLHRCHAREQRWKDAEELGD